MFANIKEFFDQFPHLDVKVYIKNKVEIVGLISSESTGLTFLKSSFEEVGTAAINLLYDPLYEQITGFLSVSREIMAELKKFPEMTEVWEHFYILAENLWRQPSLHPFHFLLFKEIVNAYKTKLKDANGNPLPDDYFYNIGQSYEEVKKQIELMISTCYARTTYKHRAVDISLKHNLFEKNFLSKIFVEMVPAAELSSDKEIILEPDLVLHPETLQDFWTYLNGKYLNENVLYKRCEKCLRYFVATGRGNVKYCDRLFEDSDKTCRQLMPQIVLQNKMDNTPAEKIYSRAYKTMYSRVSFGSMSKAAFKEWSKDARRKRDECIKGLITLEEYARWLCDNGTYIDYLKDM